MSSPPKPEPPRAAQATTYAKHRKTTERTFTRATARLRNTDFNALSRAGAYRRTDADDGHRAALDRHHPHPVDGRRPAGERRASRHRDGARAARVPPLQGSAARQPGTAALARPRPVRPQRRPRVHPPVLDPAPRRLQPLARGAEAVPAVGVGDAGPSRVPPHRGDRGHDRAARPGLRERRRDGDRRALPRRHVQPPHHTIVDHRIYAICSDGDLMEGVSYEAGSLAGQLGLGKLVYFYDDNHITIDGTTSLSFSREDKRARFEAQGWHVQNVADVNDLDALRAAIAAAQDETRPAVDDHRPLAHRLPAPHKTDTAGAHGSPLGDDEVRATKEVMGWDPDKTFVVPDGVYEHMSGVARGAGARGRLARAVRGVVAGVPGGSREVGRRVERQDRAVDAAGVRRGRRDRDARRRQDRDAGVQGRGADDDRRRGRPRRVDEDGVRRQRRSSPPTGRAATSRSASASTRWARSSTASACTAAA